MRTRINKKYKQISIIKHYSIIVLILVTGIQQTLAQSQIEFTYKTYGIENNDYNIIQNATYLDEFFNKLYCLKTDKRDKINIVHIGDSHIQADYLTEVVRKHFQRDFGNAGRGLIIPCRVAGTNEPSNFYSSSNISWTAKRCVHPLQPLPIGIGGITISTNQPEAKLNIRVNDPVYDYTFSKITLFYQKDVQSFQFSISDTTNQHLGSIKYEAGDSCINYSNLTLLKPVSQVSIQMVKSADDQKQATLFGVALENGNPGILYHAIGVNGAKYMHYNAAKYFAQQTQVLSPDIFIISLGTNESVEYPYIDKQLYVQIDKLINSLKKYNPLAKFILVTPPDAFRKKTQENPGIAIIREQIIRYAVENGLAFWDMYKALGGSNSAQVWNKEGLLRPDGIHFSKEGYQHQGDLFYNALIKSYNQYVSIGHP
jgi:lysophospholipase L1-like esterase